MSNRVVHELFDDGHNGGVAGCGLFRSASHVDSLAKSYYATRQLYHFDGRVGEGLRPPPTPPC